MCDPASLMLASGVISGIGSVYSGMQQSSAYQDQAAFAERQAQMEGQAGAYESARVKSNNDRQISNMKNQFVSNGIALEGSAKEVIDDSAREASLDEQAVLYGAKVKGDNLRFEAKLAKKNATSAMIGGVLGGVSAVANGFTSSSSYTANRTMLLNPYAAYAVA